MRACSLRGFLAVVLSSICLFALASGIAAAAPVVSGFSPSSGSGGATVTVTGSGFSATPSQNAITIGTNSYTAATASATQLTFSISNFDAPLSGPIKVTVGGATGQSGSPFTISSAVTSFSPPSGLAGTQVTVYGTNFPNGPYIKFAGGAAAVWASTAGATSAVVQVPSGASTGPVQVQNAIGATFGTSTVSFVVPQPTISSFSPLSAPEGATVVINGTNFNPNSASLNTVKFNGVAATVNSATAAQLSVTVPGGATSGPISVTVSGNSTTSTGTFTVLPAIAGFTPTSGTAGTPVVINGTSFGATAAANVVKFNGVAATINSASATALQVAVPAGFTTGPISVTTNGQTATSSGNFFLPPTITGFTPTASPNPSSITITGTNFSSTAAQNVVRLESPPNYSYPTSVTAASATSLTVTPTGQVATGNYTITVSVQGGPLVSSATQLIVAPQPTISSFTPTIAPVGTAVTINGSGFSNTAWANTVKFNGVAATVNAASPTQLTTSVPNSATTGPITVTVNTMTATSSTNFTVGTPPPPAPTITSFSPTSGPAGTQVTVYGANYGNTSLYGSLTLNGASQLISSGTDTSLTFNVAWGTTTGPIKITTAGGQQVTSSSNFVVPVPTVTGLSVNNGPEGTAVTITGTNFNPNAAYDAVSFNGTNAAITGISATQIVTSVPANATTGVVKVNVGGQLVTGPTFSVTPKITGYNLNHGNPGDTIVVQGTTLGATTGVSFNGTAATIVLATPTALQVKVPSGATSGPITATAPGATSASGPIFYMPITITGISPPAGQGNDTVTISGTGFSANAADDIVYFVNSNPSLTMQARVAAASTTSLSVVPMGTLYSGTYLLQVQWLGSPPATSAADFLVAPKPSINNFSPTLAPPGVTVTINGAGFTTTPHDHVVMFGTVAATVLTATPTALTVRVPDGAPTTPTPISVTVNRQTATSTQTFTLGVPAPASMTVPSTTDWPGIVISWAPAAYASQYQIETQAPDGLWYAIELAHYAYTGTEIDMLWQFYGPHGYAGFDNHQTYRFRVRACVLVNGATTLLCSTNTLSSDMYVDIPPPPVAPRDVTLDRSTVHVGELFEVSWTQSKLPGPPKYYRIFYTPFSGPDGGCSATVNDEYCWTLDSWIKAYPDSTADVNRGVYEYPPSTPGTYYIGVQNQNGGGDSSITLSTTPIVVLAGQRPSPPPTVTVPAATSGPIVINWEASPSTGLSAATTYQVQRLLPNVYTDWLTVNDHVPVSQLTYTDTVPQNGDYLYRVAACNDTGCSTWTEGNRAVHVVLSNGPLPTVRITSPNKGATLPANQNVTISADASVTSDIVTKVEFYDGGGQALCSPIASPYTCRWTNPNSGSHALYAIAYGAQGGITSSDDVDVIVSGGGPVDPTSPTLAADPGADASSDSVGATAGSFAVDQQGNATYTIPVYAPRGRGGLTPAVSINYSSGGGDGLIGYGWSVSGMSSISVCRQTQEHGDGLGVQSDSAAHLDPANGAVYCLDGERMVHVGGGNNGAVGAMYRLENDNQTLVVVESIIARGNNTGQGRFDIPDVFAAYSKDGTVRRFGSSAAQLSAVPQPTVGFTAAWYEYELRDSNDNMVQFQYWCSSTNGDTNDCSTKPDANPFVTRSTATIAPASIKWTGGEIDFYDSRNPGPTIDPYQAVSFGLGFAITQRYRISHIDVKGPSGKIVRSYDLSDVVGSPDNPAVRQLKSITECVGSTCYPSTTFDWSNINNVGLGAAQTGDSAGSQPFSHVSAANVRFADIDGDGRADAVWLKDHSDSTHEIHAMLASSSGAGFTNTELCTTAASCPSPAKWSSDVDPNTGENYAAGSWQLIDFDGDGRADLLSLQSVPAPDYFQWKIYPSNGSGFPIANVKENIRLPVTGSPGDALLPMHLIDDAGLHPDDDNWTAKTTIADFDGDGLPDLLVIAGKIDPNLHTFTAQRTTIYRLVQTGNANAPYAFQGPYLIDAGPGCNPSGLVPRDLRVADFNGDGRADLLISVGVPCNKAGTPLTSGLQALISRGYSGGTFTFTPTQFWPFGTTHPAPDYPKPLKASLFQVVDLNGDGLSDVVFGALDTTDNNNTAVWYYQLSSGLGFTYAQQVAGGTNVGGADQVQVGDYNGDGKGDVWIPGSATSDYPYNVYEFTGSGFTSAVQSPLYASDLSGTNRMAYQVDLDGDGHPETLRIDLQQGTWATTRFKNGGTTHQAVANNVITKITSGLGAETNIDYAPMTFGSVYYREFNGPTMYSGWGAPVQDVFTPRFVAQYVDSSAPTTTDAGNHSRIRYRYGGYKVQGFGRGALGFHTLYSTDLQTNIETVTTYNQAFPLTGTPQATKAYLLPGNDLDDKCLSQSPDSNLCMFYSSAQADFSAATLISDSSDTWAWHARGNTTKFVTVAAGQLTSPASIGLMHLGSQTRKYDINSSHTLLSASAVTMNYDIDGAGESYGNLTGSTTYEYADAAMSTVLRASMVSNSYFDPDSNTVVLPGAGNGYKAIWHLGRLEDSITTVIPYLGGVPDSDPSHTKTRESSFVYDLTTGLLLEEHVQPNGLADQRLHKYHRRDGAGNEIETDTCGESAKAAGCTSTTAMSSVTLSFDSSADSTWVQRYSRTQFDDNNIYPKVSYAPFSNGSGGATVYPTATVLQRDDFGNVIDARDLHGVETRSYFGAMGREYFTASGTGGAKLTRYVWCGGSVRCLSGAVYRVDTRFDTGTTFARAPETWTYYDALAREILKVQKGFKDGDFIAASKSYDFLGRVEYVSEPYFTTDPGTSTPGQTTAQCGSLLYCTHTEYDAFGRVKRITHPNGSATSTNYDGLSTTITLPANASNLQEQKVTIKDMLGRVFTIADSKGSMLTHAYDASGNVLSIQRSSSDTSHTPTVTMTYDDLGRKTSLNDPDLGYWTYSYNALGEQVQQLSATTCMSVSYDAQGRVYEKDTFATASCGTSANADVHASWKFDNAVNGLDVASLGVGALSQAQSTDAGITSTRQVEYDFYGRATKTTTWVGTRSYIQHGTYDQFGRPFQGFFSGNGVVETGELYTYNRWGYPDSTTDGEVSVGAQVYHQILDMDQRGNVTREKRAGNDVLTTQRTYDPAMGWLMAINTNNSLIQDLSYDYDNLGNLKLRNDHTNGIAINETFEYDDLQRLHIQNGSASTTWNYDNFGNPAGGSYGPPQTGYLCHAAGEQPPGPDALSVATDTTQYCYDAHGNQTRSLTNAGTELQSSLYGADDKLRKVYTHNSYRTYTTEWSYGPERGRLVRTDTDASNVSKRTYYIGDAEIIDAESSMPTVKRYLPGVIQTQIGAAMSYEYLFTDNLGSTHRITDKDGNVLPGGAERFTAFGQRADTASDSALSQHDQYWFSDVLTHHGFTGHEQMDESGQIHMNGRVYSPTSTRFTSPDPFVQDPLNLQSYNRYSYVLNNPLVHTDPSGYWGTKQQGYLRTAAAIAITVVGGFEASAAVNGSFITASTAAQSQAVGISIMSGGTAGYVQSGNLKGALIGAISASVNVGIGAHFPEAGSFANVSSHAVAGGVLNVLGGGKFGHGFVSAGLSAAINPHIPELVGKNFFVDGVAASLVGGTISEVSGGKFANGAMSSAFEFSFNCALDLPQCVMQDWWRDTKKTTSDAWTYYLAPGLGNALKASLAIGREVAGVGELVLGYGLTDTAVAAPLGIPLMAYGSANMAGGVSDYINIFGHNYNFNYVERGYSYVSIKATGNDYGPQIFLATDTLFNGYNYLRRVPVEFAVQPPLLAGYGERAFVNVAPKAAIANDAAQSVKGVYDNAEH